MSQVHLEELLLLLLLVQFDLNLVKCFLWAEMRLVVKRFNGVIDLLFSCFLCNLLTNELSVGLCLLLLGKLLDGLHSVHVVDSVVELGLLSLSHLLHIVDV